MSLRRTLVVSVVLLAVIGLPAMAAWCIRHASEVAIDCYVQENIAQMLIEHMERNKGQWPRAWSDLAEAQEICQAEGRGYWSLEELQQRCSIDFTANPEELGDAKSNGEEPPFRVVWLNSGKKHHWSGGEPNQVVLEYLQEHTNRPANYRPPSHLAVNEQAARQALLKLGAQWRVDDRGHVVFLHMGSVRGSSRFSDADLVHVAALAELQELLLCDSAISDHGLKQLEGLKHLQLLDLSGTRITDDGLQSLANLSELTILNFAFVNIRGDGLKHLQRLPVKTINLNLTELTDAGVEHLCRMEQLDDIMVGETHVTSAGAAQLKGKFPAARIYWAERKR